MKLLLTFLFSIIGIITYGQPLQKLILMGDYTYQDSIKITNAYLKAGVAVEEMYNAMENIWNFKEVSGKSKKAQREERWKADKEFMTWLGNPDNIGKAHRKINKMHVKFQSKFILEVIKEDEGRCGRFVSAWAIPYGKLKIRLCRNFLNFRPHNQEKVLIHELGHEAGLLFDRGVYRCGSALSVAANPKKNRATRRPENYAWLAMSYLGVECNSKRYVSPQSY